MKHNKCKMITNPNCVHSQFPHKFKSSCIYINHKIVRVKILMLIKWSYKFPNYIDLLRMVNKLWVQTLVFFEHDILLVSVLTSIPNHTSLKYKCPIKRSHRIRISYTPNCPMINLAIPCTNKPLSSGDKQLIPVCRNLPNQEPLKKH